MGHSSTMLYTLVSAVGTLAALALEITLLVVVLTTVRRHRPDAAAVLAGSAGVTIFSTLASSFFYVVAARLMDRASGGIDAYMTVQAAFSAAMIIVRGLAAVLLIIGLARIAAPPRAVGDPGRYQ
jgi:hypothetical protein